MPGGTPVLSLYLLPQRVSAGSLPLGIPVRTSPRFPESLHPRNELLHLLPLSFSSLWPVLEHYVRSQRDVCRLRLRNPGRFLFYHGTFRRQTTGGSRVLLSVQLPRHAGDDP